MMPGHTCYDALHRSRRRSAGWETKRVILMDMCNWQLAIAASSASCSSEVVVDEEESNARATARASRVRVDGEGL